MAVSILPHSVYFASF